MMKSWKALSKCNIGNVMLEVVTISSIDQWFVYLLDDIKLKGLKCFTLFLY